MSFVDANTSHYRGRGLHPRECEDSARLLATGLVSSLSRSGLYGDSQASYPYDFRTQAPIDAILQGPHEGVPTTLCFAIGNRSLQDGSHMIATAFPSRHANAHQPYPRDPGITTETISRNTIHPQFHHGNGTGYPQEVGGTMSGRWTSSQSAHSSHPFPWPYPAHSQSLDLRDDSELGSEVIEASGGPPTYAALSVLPGSRAGWSAPQNGNVSLEDAMGRGMRGYAATTRHHNQVPSNSRNGLQSGQVCSGQEVSAFTTENGARRRNDQSDLEVDASSPYPGSASLIGRSPDQLDDWIFCITCGKAFSGDYRKGNLGRHRRQKHGSQEQRYVCEVPSCSAVFKRQDARLKHYRRRHPEFAQQFAYSRR